MPLKTIIITQEDCLYLPQFLQTVLRQRGRNIVGITILPTLMPKQTWFSTAREHLEVYGLTQFLKQSIRYVCRKALGVASSRVPMPGYFSVAAVARQHQISEISTHNVNAPEYHEELRRLDVDLIISINASQVFKSKILELPRLGCINVHGALLPRYRGRLPSFWVLANGEKETGATVHFMNENLDDGPILLQERVEIRAEDTQDSLIRRTKALGARLVVEAIDRLEAGNDANPVATLPNKKEDATYFSFPTREDGIRLRQQGRRLL
jgi:methionyl-tRNA formyltransferase